MSLENENATQVRRRSQRQVLIQSDAGCNVSADRVIDEDLHNRRISASQYCRIFAVLFGISNFFFLMHKSTKTGLIGIAILICVAIVVLLLNIESIKSSSDVCVKLDGHATCHSSEPDPYRYYGTKTAYLIAVNNRTDYEVDVEGCEPKLFYLLSRHATRYPDKKSIKSMLRILPHVKEDILNSFLADKVKICQEDLEKFKMWTEKLDPEDDNRISETGEQEAMDLAQRLKARFPSILDQEYSPKKFTFEYTSRERTRSTAEFFAQGLFGENYKNIDFEDKTNDDVLQFHKDCKKMMQNCTGPDIDISQIERIQNGSLMQDVLKSISKRVGFVLNREEVMVIYKACVFGYALDINDIWCSLFSKDELKVLEFADDVDDYYKDAYGNKINYEQACPAVDYIINLLRSSVNSSESKAILHFSHAGGIKKIYSLLGLFRDEKPMTADNFCSLQERKWRSSLVAPFNTNLVLTLYQCKNEYKIMALHNEKPVIVDGCDAELCSLEDFYEYYSPIAEKCDIKKLCCTCCLY